MKGLNQFQKFDYEAFLEGKTFLVVRCTPWLDFNTKVRLGTKVECVISEDKTHYLPSAEGDKIDNRYEKISFKIRKDISIPEDSRVIPTIIKASVYGEYRNMVSFEVSDITIADKPINPLIRKA